MKKKIIFSLFIAGLLLGGCQKNTDQKKEGQPDGKEIKTEQLAADVRNKYKEDQVYADKKLTLARDENVKIDIAFDPVKLGMKDFREIVEVFQDPELTQSVNTGFEMDEDHTKIEIVPPKSPLVTISTLDLENNVAGNEVGALHLFDKGTSKDWGNLQQYYMAVNVDLKTGKKLEKPIITVITVKQEIAGSIRVKMTLNDEGLPTFDWKKVTGADYYYVMAIDYSSEKGYVGNGLVVGETKETNWTPKDASKFRTYKVSEYERRTKENKDKYGEGTEPIAQESTYETRYVVIAVTKDGTSAISNGLDVSELAKRIPYTQEVGLTNEQEGSSTTETFGELPAYQWITMCDGSLVQKLIHYDISKAKEDTETWGTYEKEDMSDLKAEKVDLVKIPYTVEGTGYTGAAKVTKYDKKTLDKDLKALKDRQDKLQNKAGSTDVEMTTEEEKKETDESTNKVYESKDKITANSALSEYLAINMLSGSTRIDIKEFSEALDQEFLFDAWMEAIYQNPLILGAKSAAVSSDGKTLMVRYDTSSSEMIAKQKELRQEVKKVVSEIIKEGMTDLEKEYAINQYLCEVAEYDNKALQNAEKNNFKKVDSEFNDSFTPYGVLVNKVGVCASYAGAFKLLSDEAGLETIVTTGYLEGNLPHAWNKVKINGQWHVVDSTNNDNELVTNALLNIPNKISQKVLVEDDRYVLDKNLVDYKLNDEDKDSEYYHVESKYFDENQIVDELVSSLEKDGSARLRTSYDLDDERFASIGSKVVDKTQNENLQGLYWMGVIYLQNGKN